MLPESVSEGLSDFLLDLLVCPVDKNPLAYIQSENILYNPRLKKAYRVKDAIPVLLEEESLSVDNNKHEEYMTKITRYTGKKS